MPENLERFAGYRFLAPGELIDGELELVVQALLPYQPEKGYVPAYHFVMLHRQTHLEMGAIELRVGLTERLKEFGGHIGYAVHEPFRGRHYAARSCRLLLPLCRKLGINPVIITCDPANTPSVKTIESLGCRLISTKIIEIEPQVFRPTNVYHLYLE